MEITFFQERNRLPCRAGMALSQDWNDHSFRKGIDFLAEQGMVLLRNWEL
jgi:hypothetical protein